MKKPLKGAPEDDGVATGDDSGDGSGVFPLQQGVLNYTHTFSSRVVNDFRAGVNYFPAEDKAEALPTSASEEKCCWLVTRVRVTAEAKPYARNLVSGPGYS